MYHFLFVPLTLGLPVLLVVMESICVTTDRTVWRAAGARRHDGILPRSQLHLFVLLWLAAADPWAAPDRHRADGAGHQPARAVDPHRQRLRALRGVRLLKIGY
jgi:hypothetical protein